MRESARNAYDELAAELPQFPGFSGILDNRDNYETHEAVAFVSLAGIPAALVARSQDAPIPLAELVCAREKSRVRVRIRSRSAVAISSSRDRPLREFTPAVLARSSIPPSNLAAHSTPAAISFTLTLPVSRSDDGNNIRGGHFPTFVTKCPRKLSPSCMGDVHCRNEPSTCARAGGGTSRSRGRAAVQRSSESAHSRTRGCVRDDLRTGTFPPVRARAATISAFLRRRAKRD
jgi:hypothetical protein